MDATTIKIKRNSTIVVNNKFESRINGNITEYVEPGTYAVTMVGIGFVQLNYNIYVNRVCLKIAMEHGYVVLCDESTTGERMNVARMDEIAASATLFANRDKYGYDGEIRGRHYESCVCCGKPVYDDAKFHTIHLSGNGDVSDYPSDYPEHFQSCEQGFWRIGNGCYRKFKSVAHNVDLNHYIEHAFDDERFSK